MYDTPRNVDSRAITKGKAEEELPQRFTTGCTLFAHTSLQLQAMQGTSKGRMP